MVEHAPASSAVRPKSPSQASEGRVQLTHACQLGHDRAKLSAAGHGAGDFEADRLVSADVGLRGGRAVRRLGWVDIVRLGLVQMSIGAIVVLTTSTLNRIMVVELALPAMLPGALVALYYIVQLSRPNWGYRSDTGGARTPWILGGMAVLARRRPRRHLRHAHRRRRPRARPRGLGRLVPADRRRRGRGGHLAARAARHRDPPRPPGRRRHHHLADDDLRDRADRRRRRRGARPLFARPPARHRRRSSASRRWR